MWKLGGLVLKERPLLIPLSSGLPLPAPLAPAGFSSPGSSPAPARAFLTRLAHRKQK